MPEPFALVKNVRKLAVYMPLLFPIGLFLSSLWIPPRIFVDAGIGFLALRSMLEGGAFNSITVPDPTNIANDAVIFLSYWTPGQYLVPGFFIWLGTSYGLGVSLTAIIATLIGVAGWIKVARSFAVSSFVLFLFVLGINTFAYVTLPFRMYTGGELLLFAAAPWSLYGMRWAATKPPLFCLTISLLSVALLFFAKLTGLIVFATNVVAISLLTLVDRRRLNGPTVSMWVGSAIGLLCFMMFWIARGPTPATADGSTFGFSWLATWFSVSGISFSGVSGLELLHWFLGHPWVRISSDFSTVIQLTYVLGPLGVLLMAWSWLQLRYTPYREMAVLLLTIILLYAIVLAAMCGSTEVPFEERYWRYAGILFFLLLITAIDQSRLPVAKGLACVVVIVLGLYGVKSAVTGAYAQVQAGYYDPKTGISQDRVSPALLEYLRYEAAQHGYQRPILIAPSPSAYLALPGFRILHPFGSWNGYGEGMKWAGRAEKIFVVLPERSNAEFLLRKFTGYDFYKWRQTKLDGMIIFSQ